MAVSLGFGVLFATFITLILVPTSYMILDDLACVMRGMFGRREPAARAMPSGGAVGEGSGTSVNRHGGLRFSHQAGSTVSVRARYQPRRL